MNKSGYWEIRLPLTPCCATGAGATPGVSVPFDESPRTYHIIPRTFRRFIDYLLTNPRWKTTRSAAMAHANLADFLVRYLYYNQRAPVSSITEFDLRWFLYDFFPAEIVQRKSDTARMLGALRRFFDFLADEERIVCPWAAELLDDRDLIKGRRLQPRHGIEREVSVEWVVPLYRDLEQRLLIPSPTTPTTQCFADGARHWLLSLELQRLWLAWRDELIADGYNRRGPLQKVLIARQLIWEHTVHPVADRTPATIAADPHGEEDMDKGWDPFGLGWQINPLSNIWPNAGTEFVPSG